MIATAAESSILSALNKLHGARRMDGRVARNRAVEQYLPSNYTLTGGFSDIIIIISIIIC